MPRSYTLCQTGSALKIGGGLNEKSWAETLRTQYFIDIEGESKSSPEYKTRVKILWDNKYLYIATEMEEPPLWANKQAVTDNIFRDKARNKS